MVKLLSVLKKLKVTDVETFHRAAYSHKSFWQAIHVFEQKYKQTRLYTNDGG